MSQSLFEKLILMKEAELSEARAKSASEFELEEERRHFAYVAGKYNEALANIKAAIPTNKGYQLTQAGRIEESIAWDRTPEGRRVTDEFTELGSEVQYWARQIEASQQKYNQLEEYFGKKNTGEIARLEAELAELYERLDNAKFDERSEIDSLLSQFDRFD